MIKTIIRFLRPFVLLLAIMFTGSLGYHVIENYNFIDSLYMTVITFSTVGYGEIRPLSTAGKLFTIFLIFGGVAFYGLLVNTFLQLFMEKGFRNYISEGRMLDKISKLKNHIIICGGGRMAQAIGEELQKTKEDFVIIEQNTNNFPGFQSHKFLYFEGNALQEDVLLKAGIKKAKGLICVLPTDADNLFVVLSARECKPTLFIITRISQESSRRKMTLAGANKIMSPYHLGGVQMARKMLNPALDDYLEVILGAANVEFNMQVLELNKGHELIGKKLSESDIREKGFMVLSVVHGESKKMYFAPDPEYIFEEGDHIMLIGSGDNKQSY